MRRLVLMATNVAVVLALLSTNACKTRVGSKYDVSSAEATMRSFFGAMNKKRIPADLQHFMSTTNLLREWQFRCKKGCYEATYKVVRREQKNPSKVVLYVDFTIRIGDGRKIRGTAQPVIVDKLADQWLIGDFGKRLSHHTAPAKPAKPAVPAPVVRPTQH